MYPYELFWGIDLYTLMITVGVVACLLLIRLQGDMRVLKAKLQNDVLTLVPMAVALGYGASVLAQAFYNMIRDGHFALNQDTGSTFYGGLLGGAVAVIVVYFGLGHFRYPDGYHIAHFRDVLDLAPACITVAHGFGRIGCLMAGCCHGAPTDAWYGVNTVYHGYRVVPVQLFEALFLFALCGVLLLLMKTGRRHQMPVYMMSYSTWRFLIEYARADDRGQTVVSFLSPSQLFSVLLMLGGIVILAVELYVDHRKGGKGRGESDA
jgi:phosphatidylglycerol:prolipoprotein diacylglycerol transferase